jgi:hypothetical protein
LYCLVYRWVQPQLFGAFCGFEGDEEVGDGASIASKRVLGFFGRELGYLAFVDLLGFLDTETYRVASDRGANEDDTYLSLS